VGLIRKMTSVSTMGAVGFQSPREKQARAALIAAKAAKTEAKAVRKMARGK
jgi:ribosomal protein S11